jgi:hypothetical protein
MGAWLTFYESGGREFESLRARQQYIVIADKLSKGRNWQFRVLRVNRHHVATTNENSLAAKNRSADSRVRSLQRSLGLRGPPPRPPLRRLRESITSELLKAGFVFDSNNPDRRKFGQDSNLGMAESKSAVIIGGFVYCAFLR